MASLEIKEFRVNGSDASLWGGLSASFEINMVSQVPNASFWPVHAFATLYVQDGSRERVLGMKPLWGIFGQSAPAGGRLATPGEVVFPLDPAAFERLDEIRAGGNLRLRLAIRVGLVASAPLRADSRQEVYAEARVEVPRSDWADRILPAAGFDQFEVWETRRLVQPASGELESERVRIRRAIQALNHSEWKTAFAESREAIRSIKNRKELSDLTDAKVAEKLAGFLSQALHVEELPTEWEPGRPDAVLAVSTAKAVVDWMEALLAARST